MYVSARDAAQLLISASTCQCIVLIGRRGVPPVESATASGLISKPWRERPRCGARGVAPRLKRMGSFTPRLACRCLTRWCDGCAASTRRPLNHDLGANHDRILLVDQVQVHDRFLRRVTRKI